MATYKVLQDIEAEDKLLGPLSLKQFIFAAIFLGLGFIGFTTIASTAPAVLKLPVVAILVPPMVVFGFLAAPISKDQPNDVWLLARLRFLLKPHRRIWNQDGISDLVTINVPKKIEKYFSNGLSQTEVKSRLQALANTLDSRGWAVKNVATNLYSQPGYLTNDADSDRLVSASTLPQEVPAAVVTASDDILDTQSNPTAQHLDQLVQQSTQSHRQQAISQMHPQDQQTTPQDYWFMGQATPQSPLPQDYATFSSQQVVAPGTTDVHPAAKESEAEHELAEKLAARNEQYKQPSPNLKVIKPLHDREGHFLPPAPTQQVQAQANDQRQPQPNPAILGLAHNDDLNVATIARQAEKISKDDDEVVISLH